MRKIIILLTLLILPLSYASDYGVHWEDTDTNINIYQGNLTNLSEMQDVNTPSPTNDQFLAWDSATSTWIAKTFSTAFKWIIDTSNGFFYNSTDTLYFNDTLLNNTIDDRAVTTETDPVWTSDKTDYSTTAEIIAFGYYNSTDFIITDYFTSSEILAFDYYNSTNFNISDYYLNSNPSSYWNDSYATFNKTYADGLYAEIGTEENSSWNESYADTLYYAITNPSGFYNSTDFSISDYFTSAQIIAFDYYNSTNFNISDYVTSATLSGYNYYNSTDFNISDYVTNIKVDSLGNFSAYVQPTHLTNFTDDLGDRGYTSNLNFTNDAGYYNLSDFNIGNYYLLSNPYDYYNSTTIPDYILSSNEGNLNVNSSDYWDTYNIASDLNNLIEIAGENITSGTIGYARLPTLDYLVLIKWENITNAPTVLSFFDDDLGDRGYTHLTNFTDDLGDRGYTHLTNFTNDLGIGNWTADKVNYYTSIETDTAIETANTSMKTYVDGTFITLANEGNLNVNSSDYWDTYNTANTTWFKNLAGVLSLKLSELNSWTNAWLSTKTTDDLTEGSTNLYDNQSWNESLGDDKYVNIDGDTMTGNLNLTEKLYVYNTTRFYGSVVLDDTEDDTHFLNAYLQNLDEMRKNNILSPLNFTYVLIGSDLYLNITHSEGERIVVNIDGEQTGVNSSYQIMLIPGTSANPVLNYIYFENKTNPTLTVSSSEPFEHNALASRVLLGNVSVSGYNIYASLKGNEINDGFMQGIFRRFRLDGLLYKSGFNPNANNVNVTISTGEYMYITEDKESINNLSMLDDRFFFVKSDGTYIETNSLADITEYSDGTIIGANKEFNVVWGIVRADGITRLMAVIQDYPGVLKEYSKPDEAEHDQYQKTNYFPSIEMLKTTFLPIARTIVSETDDEFKSFLNGYYYSDVRGSTAGQGGSPPSPSITSHSDLSNLDYASSGHTGFMASADEPNLNVNSSDYWDSYNIASDLNNLIISNWENITNAPALLSNFSDDLGDRGYTSNLNFTNDASYWNDSYATFNKSYADILYYDISNPSGFYNSSDFVISDYSTTANIIAFGYYNSTDFVITDYFTKSEVLGFSYYNSSDFSISDYYTSTQIDTFAYYNASNFDISDYFTSVQVLGFNYYNSSDFVITDYFTKTDVLGFNYYNATDFVITDYSTKTVADTLYAPINYGDDWNKTYADGLYRADSWDNFTGIPHATPSNGDITHFSYADEIYDWVIGLGYSTTSYVDTLVGSVGNWTEDKSDYSTTVQANSLYAPINYGDDWNKTYADGLYYDISNPSGFYNSTDFSIGDYFTSAQVLGFSYYNSTDFSIGDYSTKTVADTLYAPINYGDDWNKTYADGLYADIGVTTTITLPAENITSGTFGTGNYVMDSNLTTERIVFENDNSHLIEDNSTCIKIYGDTSILEIC